MERKRRNLLRGWSLEAKCLVALGAALAISFVFAMVLMQWIAERLVLETTRLEARDFALSSIISQHIDALAYQGESDTVSDSASDSPPGAESVDSEKNSALLRSLRKEMNLSGNSFELMRLDDNLEWKNLGGMLSESEIDLEALYSLESKLGFNQDSSPPNASGDQVVDESEASPSTPVESGEEKAEALSIQLSGPSLSNAVFEEFGPVNGYYYYYHPIRFTQDCMTCHAATSQISNTRQSASTPFRVMRIKRPYEDTRIWTIWTYSLMIAVAVATLSIALFLEHRILKRLVIRPLKYLRDIADRVAGGELAIRSEIDTRDEFQSLSNSFNDMLRHLVDTQTDLQGANKQLDERIDDLARVNLELFEANRMKNEFLANMSHELRTPLNSILGFSDVLQNIDALNEKQKRYAANIQRSGRVLLDMINDILDLAKIEAGKMQLRCTEFDLANVVTGQCELIRPLSDEKNIDLKIMSTDYDDDRLRMFQDKGKLQQILNNLLSNAIKFTPEGGLISVSMDLSDSEMFTIAVQDTGVGIAESDCETIFEKFRQLRAKEMGDALTREVTGTGLGLSITKELCRLLGGEIEVQSELGKGSTFIVTLPRNYETTRESREDLS